MRIVFLGPPGSGKGTQAQILAQKIEAPQISSGDLLREAVKNNTPTGRKARVYMDAGELVPDSIVIALMQERIEDEKEFILDGFPRNVNQAEKLDHILQKLGMPLDGVVNIAVPLGTLVERLSGRLTCKTCNTIYHVKYNPPERSGICDLCNGELYQRSDDTEAAITRRFETYTEQTAPLIQYYTEKRLLITVDGAKTIEAVAAAIEREVL